MALIKPKAKGSRRERELVRKLWALGLDAFRVAGSGAFEGLPGDVRLRLNGKEYIIEVKARASGEGFQQLERWRGQADILVLWRDRAEPQFFLSLQILKSLLNL